MKNQMVIKIPKQFLKFLSVGVANTIVDIGVFTLLIYLFGIYYIISINVLSYSIGIICSFFLNAKYTFKDNDLTFKKFSKLYASSLFGMGLNTLIVYALIVAGVNTVITKISASGIVVMYNYIICKRYIFKVSE